MNCKWREVSKGHWVHESRKHELHAPDSLPRLAPAWRELVRAFVELMRVIARNRIDTRK